jgi:hypothetical protein
MSSGWRWWGFLAGYRGATRAVCLGALCASLNGALGRSELGSLLAVGGPRYERWRVGVELLPFIVEG